MLEKYPDILKVPEISQILYFISKEDLIKYIRGNKTKNSSSLSIKEKRDESKI